MQTRFKITPEVDKYLIDLSKTLPLSLKTHHHRIRGFDLKQFLKKQGREDLIPEKINLKKVYAFTLQKYSHSHNLDKMRNIFKQEGIDGVRKYMDEVKNNQVTLK